MIAAGVAVLGYVTYRTVAKPIEAVTETVTEAADYVTGGETDDNFIARAVGAREWGQSIYCWLNGDSPVCQPDSSHQPGVNGISPGAG